MTSARSRPCVLAAMDDPAARYFLTARTRQNVQAVADLAGVVADFTQPGVLAALRHTEILFTSWGCPPIDESVLSAAPALRAIVHAAGSVRWHVTDACWDRGILISSAAEANAVPVAEYTLAAILLAGKRILQVRDEYRAHRDQPFDWRGRLPDFGNYQRTIGIVGASRIGRRVIELLRAFDMTVLLYDPYLTAGEATTLGVRSVSLDELCAASDVVTIHAPELAATHHLIDRQRLALMRDGTTIINTARGSLIDQDALIGELATGRLHAVLDTTTPEYPPADSPLYDLPNVLLTPHVAGSMGNEVQRLADHATAEIARYAAGQPFRTPVHRETLAYSA